MLIDRTTMNGLRSVMIHVHFRLPFLVNELDGMLLYCEFLLHTSNVQDNALF